MNNQNNNCNCNSNPAPAPLPPVDIDMQVHVRNIDALPALQVYTTKVLKPNTRSMQYQHKNILTQEMVCCEDCKYVIRWKYDLNGQTIEIPENCILVFDGGSLKNGTIIGQDTVYINVGNVDIWGENLTREGTWREHSGGGGSGVPDKEYDPEAHSGLGRKTLQLKPDGSNILTQEDFDQTNTIYVVGYDFDLNGADIAVPSGSIIRFDGGSINNGTFRFNGVTIEGDPKGTALYGVAYKDGSPLTHNYKVRGTMSMISEFAFFNHNNSSVSYRQFSGQSIAVAKNVTYTDRDNNTVTKDLIFCLGNKLDNEGWAVIILFDKNFNMLGQCTCEDFGHAGGCTIIDDKLYIATGWSEVGYAPISVIVAACVSSSRDNIPELNTSEPGLGAIALRYPEFEYIWDGVPSWKIAAIDYDPSREEIAVLYEKKFKENEYTHAFLAILNKNFSLKKCFTVDLNNYIIDNYFGSVDVSGYQDHEGIFGDIAYRHGIVTGVFWFSFNWAFKNSEIATLIQIDGNTGTPTQLLGKFDDNGYQTEPEGIFIDHDDEDVFWINYQNHMAHDNYGIERTSTTWIGKLSLSKKMISSVLSYENIPRGNVYNKGEVRCVYVDNSYTGFTTGNHLSPFKTLETAMLMNSNASNVVFLIRPTDEPYRIKIYTVGCNVAFRRWLNEGDDQNSRPIILGARITIISGAKFELSSIIIVGDINYESALVNLLGGNLIATDTDFLGTELEPGDEGYKKLVCGLTPCNGSHVTLKGNCRIAKCKQAIRLYSGGIIDYIQSLSVAELDSVYSYYEPGTLCMNAISCVHPEEGFTGSIISVPNYTVAAEIIEHIPTTLTTLKEVELYAADIMAKTMNNPMPVKFRSNGVPIPYGDYLYTPQGLRKATDNLEWHNSYLNTTLDSHENILLGTGNIKILDNSGIDVYDRQEWRKMGTRDVPQAVAVSVTNIEGLTGGVRYTANEQGLSKDVWLTNDRGWCVFSLLAKGVGSIRLRIAYKYDDEEDVEHERRQEATYTLNTADNWKVISLSELLYDKVKINTAAVHIYTVSENPDITVCAPKLEMSSTPTQWTPCNKDFPKGGVTQDRPTNIWIGYQYFDASLGKVIVWNGTAWVNVDGTPLT